jgi:hypothetical protein
MLHITNGDTVVEIFKQVEMPGEYLSWIDVLVDGPVPRTESLEALSEVRAQFVADSDWEYLDVARDTFAARDRRFVKCLEDDEVVLWFEHDLHDQLQMLQVLDWFYTNRPRLDQLKLLHPQGYLGAAPPDLVAGLIDIRQPVKPSQIDLGHLAWEAFTAPDPSGLLALLAAPEDDTKSLPYLCTNFQRFLAEYPSTHNGLAKTEELLLEAVAEGNRTRPEIFTAYTQKEPVIFMGDMSAWTRLDRLVAGGAITEGEVHEVTSFGRKLLSREADWVRGRGIDTWLGGVHLSGADAAWRWDETLQTVAGM